MLERIGSTLISKKYDVDRLEKHTATSDPVVKFKKKALRHLQGRLQ